MKKENIVDLRTYREKRDPRKADQNKAISKELELAIKLLIYRLRKQEGPLRSG